MHRDLWLKRWCTDGCKNSIQGSSFTKSAYFLTRTLAATNASRVWAKRCVRLRACARERTGVYTVFAEQTLCILLLLSIIPLSDTAGESCQNNCPGPCCGSEVPRQAVGWRQQLKESLRPVSIVERQNMTERHSDHQTAGLRKAAWPETATRATAALSNNMIVCFFLLLFRFCYGCCKCFENRAGNHILLFTIIGLLNI